MSNLFPPFDPDRRYRGAAPAPLQADPGARAPSQPRSRCSRSASASPRSASRSRASSSSPSPRSSSPRFSTASTAASRVSCKGTSRFGAELDCLADFVNFGVAPALVLYFWGLTRCARPAGSRRSSSRSRRAAARALQRDARRSEQAGLGREFLRRHSGAGRRPDRAAAGLSRADRPAAHRREPRRRPRLHVGVAFLMVSSLPPGRGSASARACRGNYVLPIFVLVVLLVALLVSYPWELLRGRHLRLSRLHPARLHALPKARTRAFGRVAGRHDASAVRGKNSRPDRLN